ncbi:heparinase [Arthrobacter sp. CDRTa11]|uniref:heparinase II/III family protein n=1 Tax=Arthrobacter sp. CDRTa11 TaxID=2651199 RepID=UPI002265D677|nr:heparinase II/III family protein [Arthrobacter sp. CDRTa11]UZX01445.1 heparinase [Arthrobacter sp. CDRTa11]
MNALPTAGTPTLALAGGPLVQAWGTHTSPSSLADLLTGGLSGLRIRPVDDATWHGVSEAAYAGLAAEARTECGTAWPQPLVSHYARYFRDGNRTAYEGLVGARQQRLTRAVVMAVLSGRDAGTRDGGMAAGREAGTGPGRDRGRAASDTRACAAGASSHDWLDEAIDGAYLLCEQSSWSWAAHDDVFSRNGDVVPDKSRPYLDLGAGEVAAQLAWTDFVLGDSLDVRAPGLRRRIRQETAERVITPFLERLDWHWLGLDGDVHNWNPWIHTNLIAAALFLVDSPQLKAVTVARCIEGLDRFLASIPADGAIDEGFAYWWNGAGRALEGLALLEEATRGELGVDLPVVRQLVSFPHRMHLGGSWFLNVADGPARAARGLPWDMLHRWAVRLEDSDTARHAASFVSGQPEATAGLGRVLHSLLHGTEADRTEKHGTEKGGADESGGRAPLVPFTYLPSVQIMVAREAAGTAQGLLLAAKGGHNGEHHNHRDVGSVVVAVDGVPLLVDAGQPTYTAKTFGPDRYDIRAMQSAWHSVPAPFGLEQGTGKDFAADVLQAPTPDDPTLRLALGAAYGLRAEQWIRTSSLDREARQVVVTDHWDLPDAPEGTASDVGITYLAAGTVSVGRDGSATILPIGIPCANVPSSDIPSAGNGRGAVLRWEPADAVVLVDEWPLDDPLLSEVWGARLTRLRFRLPQQLLPEIPVPKIKGARGAFTLTVEATP